MGAIRHAGFRLRWTAVQQRPAPGESEHGERPLRAIPEASWWAEQRPGRDGRTPQPAHDTTVTPGPIGVLRDLAERDPRPVAEIAEQYELTNQVYAIAQGPYLALLYPDERFCSECGRREQHCDCDASAPERLATRRDPSTITAVEMAPAMVDDPEWRDAFGPRAFRLPMP